MENPLPEGHSTATSLPPLPENGETEETQVQVMDPKGDQSPIPSATTSHAAGVNEEAAEEVQYEDKATSDQEVDAAPPKRRRLARKAPSAVSAPAKGQSLEDDEESGSPPVFQAAPLRVCSTSSTHPLQSSGTLAFGGPIFGDSEDEEDEEHSAENYQPATPPVENVPILERADTAPTANEAAQPTATGAITQAAKVTAPEVGTSVTVSEPWMNHPFYHTLADSAKAYVQVEQERDIMRAELERLCREKELEDTLAAQREESRKELAAAANSAAARERVYAD